MSAPSGSISPCRPINGVGTTGAPAAVSNSWPAATPSGTTATSSSLSMAPRERPPPGRQRRGAARGPLGPASATSQAALPPPRHRRARAQGGVRQRVASLRGLGPYETTCATGVVAHHAHRDALRQFTSISVVVLDLGDLAMSPPLGDHLVAPGAAPSPSPGAASPSAAAERMRKEIHDREDQDERDELGECVHGGLPRKASGAIWTRAPRTQRPPAPRGALCRRQAPPGPVPAARRPPCAGPPRDGPWGRPPPTLLEGVPSRASTGRGPAIPRPSGRALWSHIEASARAPRPPSPYRRAVGAARRYAAACGPLILRRAKLHPIPIGHPEPRPLAGLILRPGTGQASP